MTDEQLDELVRAAALHDIGKVGIPDAILDKPGPLDAAEWTLVRRHPVIGERILERGARTAPRRGDRPLQPRAMDGLGYPDGLSGGDIPLAARVIAVCDAFDAMTGEPGHSPQLSVQEACAELRRQSGRQFDPAVVGAFLQELGNAQPEASESESPDGERRSEQAAAVAARVCEQLPDLRSPVPVT